MNPLQRKPIEIFCDGSCGRSAAGGYATVMLCGDKLKRWASLQYSGTTIARMEMKAVIFGLENTKPGWDMHIYSDNKMVIDAINRWMPNWEKYNEVAKRPNGELWERFIIARDKHLEGGSYLTFCWIRAHTGHKYNDMADKMANKARVRKTKIECLKDN